MRRSLVTLICFTISLIFGSYAYFSGPNILQYPDWQIRFAVGEVKQVKLEMYELKMDLVELIKYQLQQQIPSDLINQNLGKRVVSKIFNVQQNWQEFSLTVNKPGVYAAYLYDSSKVQRTLLDFGIFVITEIAATLYVDDTKSIVQVFDKLSNAVFDAEVSFFKRSKLVGEMKTNAEGLAIIDKSSDLVVVKSGKSYTICTVYRWREIGSHDRKVFIITDRPIYKPSDTVHFRIQLVEKHDELYKIAESNKISILIKDPKHNELYQKVVETNEFGSFWDSFQLAETAAIGSYYIEVSWDGQIFYENFLVEEYRKPEYKIEIITDKDEYISNEKINITVKVKYLNDNPVIGANVAVYVYAQPDYYYSSLVFRGYEYTDENGELNLSVATDEGFEGHYVIQAIASDESQRQIEEEKKVYVHADRFLITFDENHLWAKPGEKMKIKVRLTDLEGQAVEGIAKVKIDDEIFPVEIIQGEGNFEFTPKEIRTYKLEFTFQKAKAYVYVYSYGFWRGYPVSDFQIVTDKNEYLPGEKVVIQLFTPNKATGIAVLATDRIHDFKVFSSEDFSKFELTIPDNLSERQIFLICTGFVENKQVQRVINLKLSQKLNVSDAEIHFDKQVYEPAEECLLTVKTPGDFHLCLTIVDEAIYIMLGQKPKSLEQSIYPLNEYPEIDWSFSSEWFHLAVDYSLDRLRLAEILARQTVFEDFKSKAVDIRTSVREYFPDTAIWIPNLQTTNGVAKIIFKVPDSLTSFVATAYGFSKDSFVQAQGKFIVTKDFYVIPHLPAFLRENDIVQISATVHNRTNETLETNIWIEPTEEIDIVWEEEDFHVQESFETKTPIVHTVEPYRSVTQRWTVQAMKSSNESKIITFAQSQIKKDAVALRIPVKPFAFEREFYILEALDGKMIVDLPDAEYVSARLRTYSSVIPLLESSIKKLISFPYGCTEQTMSSFLPAVVAAQMNLKTENLDEIVYKGLMSLYKYQHSDGGWGWWQFDQTNNFMTCYVMEGFYYAIKAGYYIAESVLTKAIEYLLENPSAYGSYVLTLFGVQHEMVEPSKPLDWVYLAMESKETVDQMMKLIVEDEKFAHVKVEENDYFTTEVQMTSIALRALSKWRKYPQIQKKMINYLFSKKDGYLWYSTKDTSYACLALIESVPNFVKPSLRVTNNGRTFIVGDFEEISIERGNLILEGSGLVEIHVIYRERPKQSVDQGLFVKRRYFKRYEIPVVNKKAYIDAFIPLNQRYIPIFVKVLDEYKTKEFYLEPYSNVEFDYHGTKLKVKENLLYLDKFSIVFNKAQTFDTKILILSETSAILYNCSTKVSSIYHDVKDAAFFEQGLLLWKSDGLWLNDKYICEVPEDAQRLISDGKNIFVSGYDSTYWYKEGEFVELPFVASQIFEWDGKRVVAKNFRFAGNDEELAFTTCEVVFDDENFVAKLTSGDVVKTEIRILKGVGNYLIVEDYIPSCAQVLPNYLEKRITEYSKFNYMWYKEWEYWFTAREIHMDRVVFFAINYSSMKMSYYWRVTANGLYKVLPARAYSMYYKGLYGHSDPVELDIGVWFEICKSGSNP